MRHLWIPPPAWSCNWLSYSLAFLFKLTIVTFSIWDALRDLGPFPQFWKREKHLKPPTLLKVRLLCGCFSRFLNCTNVTKSRNALHIKTEVEIDHFHDPPSKKYKIAFFMLDSPISLSICYHGILLLIHEHAVWRNVMNFWNCVINLPSLEVGVSERRIFIFSRTTRNFLVTVFWFYQENVPCRNFLAPNPLTLVWHMANFNYSTPMKLYWTIFSYGL